LAVNARLSAQDCQAKKHAPISTQKQANFSKALACEEIALKIYKLIIQKHGQVL
jgi:hypothetical protein